MNSAKPPPPPQRPATSKPPPPPPLQSARPVPAQSYAPAQAPSYVPAAPSYPPAPGPSYAPAPSMAPPAPVHPQGPGALAETRFRVAVKLSVRDPNLLLARPLREGEAAPPGTRVAYILLVEGEGDAAKTSDGGGAA